MPSSALEDSAPLTFTFKNVGPIDSAELELGDLTIVAGRTPISLEILTGTTPN